MPKTVMTIAALRGRAARVVELPEPAQKLIARYLDIQVMGTHAACPYHINCRLRDRNRALLGKGRPEEIEAAAEAYFKLLNTVIALGKSEQLRASLRDYGIGVDCSGFAAWVLNEITQSQSGKSIWQCLRFPNVRRYLVSRIRPLENISANMLTDMRNARTVTLPDIRPGDLVRALHGGHVIVVIEAGLDAQGLAQYFRYAHSAAGSEQFGGVRTGVVRITDAKKDVAAQEWTEGDAPTALALIAVKAGGDDSRIVRLKALDA